MVAVQACFGPEMDVASEDCKSKGARVLSITGDLPGPFLQFVHARAGLPAGPEEKKEEVREQKKGAKAFPAPEEEKCTKEKEKDDADMAQMGYTG